MRQPMEAIIEEVITESSKAHPIIVNFQNGELKDEEAKKMSCGLFYDEKKQKSVLALSNGQVVYKGYKPDTKNDLTRTMLVLHNKKTGKVRLVQVERWQVNPVLQKPSAEDNSTLPDEKMAMLTKQFGSKKAKRRTEQYERTRLNTDSVRKQLEETALNVEIDTLDLSTQLPENEYIGNLNLPRCNRDTVDVKEVYDIHDIVPEEKLETLYNKATEVLNKGEKGKNKFFARVISSVENDPDAVKKTAILLYIQAVCDWLHMPIKDAKKRGIEVCAASEEMNTFIINTYSVQSAHGRSRPNSVKDKGVIHCMILALTICNFVLDLEAFLTILNNRMGLKKLTDIARIIGALPTKEDKKVISLKVPLPSQVPVVKKGKKK